jgi:hypothetical protein
MIISDSDDSDDHDNPHDITTPFCHQFNTTATSFKDRRNTTGTQLL